MAYKNHAEFLAHRREYYATHKEKWKEYAATHREELLAYQESYRKTHDFAPYKVANRDAILAQKKEYNDTHKNEARAYAAAHREQNREHSRKYLIRHRDELVVRCRDYYAMHKQEYLEREREWRKLCPEKVRLQQEKRRALKYANTPIGEMLTSVEWLAILAEHNGHCHYCGKEAKLTLDHVIPLSGGGKHSASNVVPACKHCNSSKGHGMLEEWLVRRAIA